MKKWQFVGTTALGATLLLGACGGGNGGSGNSDLKGEAKGDGSSTVAPIVEKLNENGLKITRMLKSQQDKLVQVLVSKIHCRRYRLR